MSKELAHFLITGKCMQTQTQEQIQQELEYNDHLSWKRGDGDAPCGFLFIGVPPSKEDAPEGYVTGSCGTKFQRSNVLLNSDKMRLVLTPDTNVEVSVKKSVFRFDPSITGKVLGETVIQPRVLMSAYPKSVMALVVDSYTLAKGVGMSEHDKRRVDEALELFEKHPEEAEKYRDRILPYLYPTTLIFNDESYLRWAKEKGLLGYNQLVDEPLVWHLDDKYHTDSTTQMFLILSDKPMLGDQPKYDFSWSDHEYKTKLGYRIHAFYDPLRGLQNTLDEILLTCTSELYVQPTLDFYNKLPGVLQYLTTFCEQHGVTLTVLEPKAST